MTRDYKILKYFLFFFSDDTFGQRDQVIFVHISGQGKHNFCLAIPPDDGIGFYPRRIVEKVCGVSVYKYLDLLCAKGKEVQRGGRVISVV